MNIQFSFVLFLLIFHTLQSLKYVRQTGMPDCYLDVFGTKLDFLRSVLIKYTEAR